MPMVIDASVVMAWHFGEEQAGAARMLMDRALVGGILVPSHWRAEIANAALMGERRRRAGIERTAELMAFLDRLALDVDQIGSEQTFALVLPLARAHGLTVYDAYYLELAERRGMPLASFDANLIAAARAVGIDVINTGD